MFTVFCLSFQILYPCFQLILYSNSYLFQCLHVGEFVNYIAEATNVLQYNYVPFQMNTVFSSQLFGIQCSKTHTKYYIFISFCRFDIIQQIFMNKKELVCKADMFSFYLLCQHVLVIYQLLLLLCVTTHFKHKL